jgi:hypothetical protein
MLLPELLQERMHIDQPNLIRRTRELQVRVTCGTHVGFTLQTHSLIFGAQTYVRPLCFHGVGSARLAVGNCVEFAPAAKNWQVVFLSRRKLPYIFHQATLPCDRGSSHVLFPITRFQDRELDDMIDAMEKCLPMLVFLRPFCLPRLTRQPPVPNHSSASL